MPNPMSLAMTSAMNPVASLLTQLEVFNCSRKAGSAEETKHSIGFAGFVDCELRVFVFFFFTDYCNNDVVAVNRV